MLKIFFFLLEGWSPLGIALFLYLLVPSSQPHTLACLPSQPPGLVLCLGGKETVSHCWESLA